MGLERGPLSLVSTILLEEKKKGSGSGLERREYGRRGSSSLITRQPVFAEAFTNYANKRRSLDQYSSLADSGYGV
jgi:hypothetical protein